MLALIALNTPSDDREPIDRDPGIITLVAAIYRAVRGPAAEAAASQVNGVGPMAPSTAWPSRGVWHTR